MPNSWIKDGVSEAWLSEKGAGKFILDLSFGGGHTAEP